MRIAAATNPNSNCSPVPPSLWDPRSQWHKVQFYHNDAFLLDQLGQFIHPAIASGGSVLLIATKAHRDALFAQLRECATDFALAVAQERFLLLDADETLAKFMVNGQPDGARFNRVLTARMARLTSAAVGPSPQVFAFGEMVSRLWGDGKREAAIRLEQLWNDLAEKHAFQLLCAYPMRLFSRERDRESLLKICAEHSHVLPAESETQAQGGKDRFHSVVLLQQKTRALEYEIRERQKLQRALQERETELKSLAESVAGGRGAALVTNDLSNSLEAAVNSLYLIGQQPELCDETRRYLTVARQELRRVNQIIEQALNPDVIST
jgi:signal transduction histidine kinase